MGFSFKAKTNLFPLILMSWEGEFGRGDSIQPFVNETPGAHLALSLFPKSIEFDGTAVLDLVEPGLYRKK
jgi:hypothetical protein